MILITLTLFIVTSCKEEKLEVNGDNIQGTEFSASSWPKKSVLIASAKAPMSEWVEFHDLESKVGRLNSSDNVEELKLGLDNVLEALAALEKSTYPELFSVPQIKARQQVFKTFVQKTKGDLDNNQNPQNSAVEMLSSYNSFINQFNVLINSSIDPKAIFNNN